MAERRRGTGINDLADLGIGDPEGDRRVVSADAKAGKLVLDEAKLTAALDSDFTKVKNFLGTFSKDVETVRQGPDRRLRHASTTGSPAATARRSASRPQIDRTNERLDAREKRLKAQFAAMEVALQNSQTQGAWLSGQLAGSQREQAASSSARRLAPTTGAPSSVYSPSRATAYQEQSILTATPGQLVVMLYDGCLRFLFQAAYAMREGEHAAGRRAAAPRRGDHRRAAHHARPRAGRRDRQPAPGHLRLLQAPPDRGPHPARPRRWSRRSPSSSASCASPGPRSPSTAVIRMDPWTALLARATAERAARRRGSLGGARRVHRRARPHGGRARARPDRGQARRSRRSPSCRRELTATIAARARDIARELAALPTARGAVAGYAAAQAAPARNWVNDQA